MTPAPRPDRRLAPRPLPAHLTSAAALWLSSRVALPFLRNVSPPSNPAGGRLRALADEIDAFGPDQVADALEAEIARRAQAYLDGLEAYRRHPYRRPATAAAVAWREGASRLLDYGRGDDAPAVLVVPSLINRCYVLDLLPERSFVRHLARRGLRPLVVDWGSPGAAEIGLDLTGCVDRLDRAFAFAAKSAGTPVAVLGYCMGGLLALALALRRQRQLAGLALLATPWDFHAERSAQVHLLGLLGDRLPALGTLAATVPVELVQSLFFMLDPFLAERKFVRFAGLDPAADEARGFVALEDWINDGVPLPLAVARECLRSWYRDNAPGRGVWRVAGLAIRPQLLRRPALVVIPGRDRIVPPGSAEPLAAAIPEAEALRPPLGHVGMMSAARAPEMLWTPIAEWLRAQLARP
jgi:polyhydroxyalkanoate synthase subunit PhaC